MPLIEKNLNQLYDHLSMLNANVTVVVAAKYATSDQMNELSKSQHPIIFGINRVQDGQKKQTELDDTITPWHFIGHLQRNKVKNVISSYSLIHSVDSLRLMKEINIQSEKRNQITDLLLQVNPLEEDSKFGFSKNSIFNAIETSLEYRNINIQGLMSMAPNTENKKEIAKTFKSTRKLFDKIKSDGLKLTHLSMGMSNDYEIAIQEGSTMIRIGSIIFK